MIDITRHIFEARSLARGWGPKRVRRTLKILAKAYPDAVVDWEEGDEEWGRVVSFNDATAYVSARYPIAFVEDRERDAIPRFPFIAGRGGDRRPEFR